MDFATLVIVTGISLWLFYMYALALASLRVPAIDDRRPPTHRFAIAIPAHNEAGTIGETIRQLQRQHYPPELVALFVVADNCSDATASVARAVGATCWERDDPARNGKGHALAWLLDRILAHDPPPDAVVVFDADSFVDTQFLRVMDGTLRCGHRVIQGNHVIRNATHGWLPAMTFVSFTLDNRLRNLGRSNLGLSSKLMGDAMCFSRAVLAVHPWRAYSETEDTEYWCTLLLARYRVVFAPHAISGGEILPNLGAVSRQRSRWIRGRARLMRRFAFRLLGAGLRGRNRIQLDAALELLMPSYSTVACVAALATALGASGPSTSPGRVAWSGAVWAALLAYPLLGLALEGAPRSVYLFLVSAPAYVTWRTCLGIWATLRPRQPAWIRTPRAAGPK